MCRPNTRFCLPVRYRFGRFFPHPVRTCGPIAAAPSVSTTTRAHGRLIRCCFRLFCTRVIFCFFSVRRVFRSTWPAFVWAPACAHGHIDPSKSFPPHEPPRALVSFFFWCASDVFLKFLAHRPFLISRAPVPPPPTGCAPFGSLSPTIFLSLSPSWPPSHANCVLFSNVPLQ